MTKETKYLTAADIFAADDSATIDVEVPEWGGIVKVRKLTAGESIEFGEIQQRDSLLKLIELCAVDERGARLFSKDDLGRLASKAYDVCIRLHVAAAKLNGLAGNPSAQAAAKNASSGAPAGASPTA
jgi:hypothetical protein